MALDAITTGVVTHVIVGLISGAIGATGSYTVLAERITYLKETQGKMYKRLEEQDSEIHEIKNSGERNTVHRMYDSEKFVNLEESIKTMRQEIANSRKSFETCIEKLIAEVKKK